jgi:hypothetical protein
MRIERSMMLNAAKIVARRANMIGLIYLSGAIYALIQEGFNWSMTTQMTLVLVLIGSFNYSLNYLQTHQKFNHLKILKITDIPSLLYCGYILVYYIIYAGYQLFNAFHWPELLLLIGNIVLLMTLYNNAISYNVIVGNLTYFYDVNEMDISEDEWNKFKFKNQIID